ncbi:hypothetical protein Tther_01517 [Tepidimonas thermarum]|uniref:Uncharacterized protein n=1 Tax=Tepidimonas thermarum TaxID=335431 RepID=A0A554X0K1_9BURK|nr:hypothetical protein [Tepidimonas thermarum]TSE29354.1 hypothetical protein Tther_01517 [Tepidimonas thermarum]
MASSDPTAAPTVTLAPLQTLFDAGDGGGPWRVVRGLLRLDRVGRDGPLLVMLAEPGDWLGLDALAGQAHGWRATAVTPVILRGPLQPATEAERARWLTEALLQLPERAHAMALLRTGAVRQRLATLLRLLARPDVLGQTGDAALRGRLPPLRVLAELVDAKHETVCRVLGQLLPRPREAAALVAA